MIAADGVPGARVLVIGPRRSGTTWTWKMLLRTEETFGLSEPDTPVVNPHAVRVLQYDECPIIELGEEPPEGVVALWDGAFNLLPRERSRLRRFESRASWWCWDRVSDERRRDTVWDGRAPSPFMRVGVALAQPWLGRVGRRNRVIKSVISMFSLEWIAAHYHPTVVVIRRDPIASIASCLRLMRPPGRHWNPRVLDYARRAWGVSPPAPDADPVVRMAWDHAIRASRLSELVAAHPEFVAVSYEQLLADPLRAFPALAARTGLEWGDRAQSELLGSDNPGEGFDENRQWDEERRRTPELSAHDLATVRAVLADFPISDQRSDPSLPGAAEA